MTRRQSVPLQRTEYRAAWRRRGRLVEWRKHRASCPDNVRLETGCVRRRLTQTSHSSVAHVIDQRLSVLQHLCTLSVCHLNTTIRLRKMCSFQSHPATGCLEPPIFQKKTVDYKKLSYRRQAARCIVLLSILFSRRRLL